MTTKTQDEMEQGGDLTAEWRERLSSGADKALKEAYEIADNGIELVFTAGEEFDLNHLMVNREGKFVIGKVKYRGTEIVVGLYREEIK